MRPSNWQCCSDSDHKCGQKGPDVSLIYLMMQTDQVKVADL